MTKQDTNAWACRQNVTLNRKEWHKLGEQPLVVGAAPPVDPDPTDPPPIDTTPTTITFGVCPHNSGGATGAISKWYSTKPIALRVFDGGSGIDGNIPSKPAGCSILHYSFKDGANQSYSRAQIVRACQNLDDGDILEVEHEHNNASNFAGLVASKQNFATAVRAARDAGDIPHVLTCDTFTGYAFATENTANQDQYYGGSDLLGSDWDGIDPYRIKVFNLKAGNAWPSNSNPIYYDFYGHEYAETVAYMNKWGYEGWCIPEISTFRDTVNDANGNLRVGWMNQQINFIKGAAVKPYYVAFFDYSNRPKDVVPTPHWECLELTNEINAWKAAIATNPA